MVPASHTHGAPQLGLPTRSPRRVREGFTWVGKIRGGGVRTIQLLAIAAAATLGIGHATAQTMVSWIGTTSGNWTDNTKWSGGSPANSTTTNYASFNTSTGVTVTINQNRSIAGVVFGTSAGSFTLNKTSTGNRTFTIGSYGIINNSASAQTITGPHVILALGAATSFQVNGTGDLTISTASTIATTAANTLTLSGTGSGLGTVSTVIAGAGTVTKSGTGTWLLSGANTYTGGTTLSAGTLQVGNATALGTGTLTINGGTLAASGSAQSLANAVTVGGDFAIGGSNDLTLSGSINLGGGTRTVTVNNSGTTTFSGSITEPYYSTLVKAGAGDLVLSGSNSYSGGTSITAGTLVAANNSALGAASWNNTISSGATLGVQGNVSINQSGYSVTGTGDGGTGAIRNIFGNNTLGGQLSLGGNATVQSAAGTLTLTGAVGIGANTLTIDGAGNVTLSGAASDSGGTNGLTKNGTGTLTLSGTGANSITNLKINDGTVLLAKSAGVNAVGGNVTVGDGTGAAGSAVLGMGASNQIPDYVGVTLNTDGKFALNNFSEAMNTLAGNGTVDLGTSGALTIGGNGGSSTYAGSIIGSGTLTKAGSGIFTLGGSSSYSGTTTISGGTLRAGAANSLSSSSAISIANASGALLDLNGYSQSIGSIAGGGTSGGNITLGSGTLTTGGDNTSTTYNGGISGTGGLVKTGTGTLTLGGVNSFSGGTSLNAGGIIVSSGAKLAADSGGLSIQSGTLTLNNSAQTVSSLNGTGGTIAMSGGHAFTVNDTGTDSYAGTFTGAGNTSIAKTGTGTLTLSGSNTGFAGNVAINQGALVISNANALGTGTNNVSVASGGALGLANNITATNGSVSIAGTGSSGSGALYGSGNVTWNGSVNLTGNATITANSGTFTLGPTPPDFMPNGHTQPTENGYLTIGGKTLTFQGNGTVFVNNGIRDFAGQTASTSYASATTLNYAPETTNPGNVVVDMSSGGLVHYYANSNSYTGTTFVKNGTLLLDTVANGVAPHDTTTDSVHAINGAIEIGNGSSSAKLQLGSLANEIIASTSTVKLYSDGTLDLNGQLQTIGGLTFSGGGLVQLGSGALYLNGDVTVVGASGQTALIDSTGGTGDLSMTLHRATGVDTGADATRNFNVSHGAGNTSDLTVHAVLEAGNLVKSGDGTMTLTGYNTYTGTTWVNAGILNIQTGTDGNGHGGLGSGNGTDAEGTTVSSGATLQMQGNITLTWEKLNLNGTGVSNAGALENVSGSNTWGTAGQPLINLQADSRINSDAGLLTIVSNITSTGNNKALTVGGAGNTTISGGIYTGSGSTTTLTKDGTGTLTLSGSNSYQGATNITQGIVSVQNNLGLGSYTSGTDGTFVSSGAQLQLDSTAHGNLNVAAEGLTLNGTGISNTGALLNAAGDNSFGGTVTLASDSLITANAGTSLTLSGMSATTQTLTVGTTANTGNITITGTMSNGTGGLIKNGSGTLTYAGIGGVTNGTVGAIALNGGTMKVGDGTHVTNLNATGLVTSSGTSLLIASAGTVNVTGNVTLNGSIDSLSQGTLQINGQHNLTFNSNVSAQNLTLVLNGGSVGTNSAPVTVSFGASTNVTVGTIHITGDTILDFGNSSSTFLSSTNLVIDAGVKVTVVNWVTTANNAAQSTIWYLRNAGNQTATLNGNQTLGTSDMNGGTPLSQITFQDPTGSSGNTTTWVDGAHDGWFDHEIRPTPEPSTYGLILLSGCVGLLGLRRYRRRRAAAA